MDYFIYKQLPVLAPDRCTEPDLAFIVPRVLELTFTAHELLGWAQDLGYDGPPFAFDPDHRAVLRAELDAYYASLYGLTCDELRCILDPSDVMGADYPSETFRVVKNGELREFGAIRLQLLDFLQPGERGRIAFDVVGVVVEILELAGRIVGLEAFQELLCLGKLGGNLACTGQAREHSPLAFINPCRAKFTRMVDAQHFGDAVLCETTAR